MTTAYTSLLGLALPVTGELSGTWGDTVNNSITSLLDSAIAGTTTISADADVTLSTTTGAANTAREAILLWTANGTVTRNITAPAQSKIYTVINASAGTQSIVLRGAGPTTGVTILKGESALCAWNGSDFIKISNTAGAGTFTSLTVSGATALNGSTTIGDAAADSLTVNATIGSNLIFTDNTYDIGASGATRPRTLYLGTSLITPAITNSGLTAGRVVYTTTGGLETASANLTFDGTTLTANALTTTSTVTINGGTANGVAYLNGSKVLTTGSALVFDGTNLGVGVASPAYKLDVQSTGYPAISVASTSASGNNGAYVQVKNGGGSVSNFGTETTSGSYSYTGAIANSAYLGSFGANTLQLVTNSVARATIDTSGNLGLGVTPSAWTVVTPVAQINTSSWYGYSNESRLNTNFYYGGGDKYMGNGYATSYNQAAGQHKWFTAANNVSGAGAALSWAQAMTLDTSGNLLVGTTTSLYSASGRGVIEVSGGSTAIVALKISNAAGGYLYHDGTNMSVVNGKAGALGFDTNGATRMTINTSGNVGIGTQTPTSRLHVDQGTDGNGITLAYSGRGAGSTIWQLSGVSNEACTFSQYNGTNTYTMQILSRDYISWYTGNAERARVDANGNLCVGTTGGGKQLNVAGSNNVDLSYLNTDGGFNWNSGPLGTGLSGRFNWYYANTTSDRMYLTTGGALYNSTGTYGTISDVSLKENIVDATPKLDDVMRLRVRNYNMKADPDKRKVIGVVAQELEEVFPGLIEETVNRVALEDGTFEENAVKAVKYSVLTTILVKAIQEQQAIIESLKARLDAANL